MIRCILDTMRKDMKNPRFNMEFLLFLRVMGWLVLFMFWFFLPVTLASMSGNPAWLIIWPAGLIVRWVLISWKRCRKRLDKGGET